MRTIIGASLVAVGLAAFALAQAAPPAGSSDAAAKPAAPAKSAKPATENEKQKMAMTCAAFYRWQAGPADESSIKTYEYLKSIDSSPPEKLFRAIGYARDQVETDVKSGRATKGDVAKTLRACSTTMGIPAPATDVRSTAFPEPVDKTWASKVRLCAASYLWQAGITEETKGEIALLARAIQGGPEDALAQAKKGADNIQRALDNGGLTHSDLTMALSDCPDTTDIKAPPGPLRTRGLGYEEAKPDTPQAGASQDSSKPALKIPGLTAPRSLGPSLPGPTSPDPTGKAPGK